MNCCVLAGYTSKEVTVKGEGDKMTARTGLALNRPYAKEGQPTADFVSLVAFGKRAKTLADYVSQGRYISVRTHVSTGKYENKEGVTVYTTDFIIDDLEFGPKNGNDKNGNQAAPPQNSTPTQNNAPAQSAAPVPASQADGGGFMNIPEGMDDKGLPWDMPQ